MGFFTRNVARNTRIIIPLAIQENSVAKDITGFSFVYAVKDAASFSAFKIGPLAGTIVSAADGKIQFVLTNSDTDLDTFNGVEGMTMFDSDNSAISLTPPGGNPFNLTWSITQ